MDVREIEIAIMQLPPGQVAELAGWFEEYHARLWDTRIENDVESGRLDSTLDEAAQDLEAGRCKPI